MAKGSRKKARRPRRRQKRSAFGFGVVMTLLVVLGVAGIALSRGGKDEIPGGSGAGPKTGDHWHAAFGVNVCGEWKPNTPQYESGSGIHSHADGFMHIHPFSRAGEGKNASVGLFMKGARESVSASSIKLFDGTKLSNGDECPNMDNKPGKVRWSVNGEEKKGDPAKYVPHDTDVVALAFIPEGEQIGNPPVSGNPSDVPADPMTQGSSIPVNPGG
jgi:hypothetical protein